MTKVAVYALTSCIDIWPFDLGMKQTKVITKMDINIQTMISVESCMIHVTLAVQRLFEIPFPCTKTPCNEKLTPSQQHALSESHIPEQHDQESKEPNPNLPANTSSFRHAQHPIHRTS